MGNHHKQNPTGKVPTGAILTKHLKMLSAELLETVDDSGRSLTRAEALADLLWRKALGYTRLDPETKKEKYYPPESWAILAIYERLEGRSPMALTETKGGTVAERVSELGRDAINKLSTQIAGALSKKAGNMGVPQDRPESPEAPGPESDVAG
jgi:hypothetical protein